MSIKRKNTNNSIFNMGTIQARNIDLYKILSYDVIPLMCSDKSLVTSKKSKNSSIGECSNWVTPIFGLDICGKIGISMLFYL